MLKNLEGKKIPHITLKTRDGHEWVEKTTEEIFGGKTVALFALPGAFTPTCSSTHVPRFNDLAGTLKENGVDEIICTAVNDAFVMAEWAESQSAANITFLPDGNGDLADAMGMLVEKNDLGFGKRSWRYSMLVKDGVIDKMFIEPEVPGDPFEVSDADTMLGYVNPNASAPASVTIFTRKGCPFCVKAKDLLAQNGLEYEELVLNKDYGHRTLRAVSGQETVPQIFIEGEHIGGSEQLEVHLKGVKAA